MKFGKYILEQADGRWRGAYLDYRRLKELIKASVREVEALGGGIAFSPRTTSLSVQRPRDAQDRAEESFFTALEEEVRSTTRVQTPGAELALGNTPGFGNGDWRRGGEPLWRRFGRADSRVLQPCHDLGARGRPTRPYAGPGPVRGGACLKPGEFGRPPVVGRKQWCTTSMITAAVHGVVPLPCRYTWMDGWTGAWAMTGLVCGMSFPPLAACWREAAL